MSNSTEPRICEVGGSGLWLPLGGDAEQRESKTLRAFIYGFFLCYTFLGVDIVAGAFMTAIEAVTSSKKRVYNQATGRYVTLLVWNDTVKNLSLLALGSSAPEILLSVIETFSNEFFSGALGPSTIVGSAAFNLLVIIAVCILAIQSPEVRYIKEITVYNVTAIFSLFAYGWLLIIVEYSSKDVISLWEAVATFIFFPVLVVVSFAADVGYFPFSKTEPKKTLDREVDEESGLESASDKPGREHKANIMNARFRRASAKEKAIEHKAALKRNSLLATPQGSGDVESGPKGDSALQTLPAGDDGELIRQDGKPIINACGVITFCSDEMKVRVNETEQTICVPVLRRNGTTGSVSCKYHTEMWSAISFFDFDEVKGELVFESGVDKMEIYIKIKGKRKNERSDMFQLVLDDITGGAQFNPNDDGGEDSSILTLSLENENEGNVTLLKSLSTRFLLDSDVNKYGRDQYFEQIKDAMSVSGGEDNDGEEQEPPSKLDYVMHYMSLPWKLLYAVTTPPPIYAGGWLLFFVALVHIAIITAAICDLASAFGCCIEIDDSVTAITVVALGTSLPDLFASQSAARDDEFADASIVNVTGSNSVNVFLGIGIPWLISAVYWKVTGATDKWKNTNARFVADYPDGAFIVEAGDLAFSVTVFSSCALMCITLLRVKRLLVGGELGGPAIFKFSSGLFLVFLWFTYIILSILRTESESVDTPGKIIMIALSGLVVLSGILVEVGSRTGVIPSKELGGGAAAMKKVASDSPTNDTQRLLEVSSETSSAVGGWQVAIDVPADTEVLPELPDTPDSLDGISQSGNSQGSSPAPKSKSKAKSKAAAAAKVGLGPLSPKAKSTPKGALRPEQFGKATTAGAINGPSGDGVQKSKTAGALTSPDYPVTSIKSAGSRPSRPKRKAQSKKQIRSNPLDTDSRASARTT